jgi:hypothetical protein
LDEGELMRRPGLAVKNSTLKAGGEEDDSTADGFEQLGSR